jgi:hypothetical protein
MPSLMFVCRDKLLNEMYREEMRKESVSLLNFQKKNERLTDFPPVPYKQDT